MYLEILYHFQDILKKTFQGPTPLPLKGAVERKKYEKFDIIESMISIMLFKNVVIFEIYYVTYDLNYGMVRLRCTRATIPLLKLI